VKLRRVVIRMIFAWLPILPPPAIIGQPQRTDTCRLASSPHSGVIAGGCQGTKVFLIDRKLIFVGQNSGG